MLRSCGLGLRQLESDAFEGNECRLVDSEVAVAVAALLSPSRRCRDGVTGLLVGLFLLLLLARLSPGVEALFCAEEARRRLGVMPSSLGVNPRLREEFLDLGVRCSDGTGEVNDDDEEDDASFEEAADFSDLLLAAFPGVVDDFVPRRLNNDALLGAFDALRGDTDLLDGAWLLLLLLSLLL